MSKATIKEDIHVSEGNFSSFKDLKENFEIVLAEVERERPNFRWENFNYFFGKIFCLCGWLFFLTLGRGQRDETPKGDVRPVDIEFDRMPKELTILDKTKIMLFSFPLAILFGLFFTLNGFHNLISSLVLILSFLLFYFVSFMFVINSKREKYMADKIEDSLGDGNVLAYIGAAHSRGVKKRLQSRGFDVKLEFDSKIWHYLGILFSLLMNFTSRPLYFLLRRLR